MSLFDTAVHFALGRHEGQEYGKNTGIPYSYHLHEVDQIFIKRNGFGFNDTARMVVWLHDVVEDTATTLEEIEDMFGPRIAHSVDCLTKRKGEAYEVYLVRVNSDDTACEVKFCDSSMNMMQSIKEGNFERALKYLKVLETLRFIPAGSYKW